MRFRSIDLEVQWTIASPASAFEPRNVFPRVVGSPFEASRPHSVKRFFYLFGQKHECHTFCSCQCQECIGGLSKVSMALGDNCAIIEKGTYLCTPNQHMWIS